MLVWCIAFAWVCVIVTAVTVIVPTLLNNDGT